MINIIPMELKHIDEVAEIESEANIISWSKKSLSNELKKRYAIYFVAIENNIVLGYCGMYHIVDEGHITNIAVKLDHRKNGIGSRLIDKIIQTAISKKMIGVTLEVRLSNIIAQRLYTKNGFKIYGFRKNYYSEPREDAVIMWKYF